jgi:hypothetical protein
MVACILGCAPPVRSAEYHVHAGATNPPAGVGEPALASIQAAAARMRPGDTCVIHGGTYRESVRPQASGKPGQPIRFIAASGEKVVVTGTDPVIGWARHGGRIFKARVTEPVAQVFVNGERMVRARYPNAGPTVWAVRTIAFTNPVGASLVADVPEREPDYWKGATVWGLNQRQGWVASSFAVTGSVGRTILFAGKAPPWYGGGPGRGFLAGKLAELDAEREWHQEDGVLYLWAPGGADPSGAQVEVGRRPWAFDLAGLSNAVVSGVHVFAAGVNLGDSTDCLLEGLRVQWPCGRDDLEGGFNRNRSLSAASEGIGIALGGARNTIRDSVVAYSTGDGLSLFGASNTVENCVVHDCDLSASDCAPVSCTGVGHAIRRSTLFNGGRSVIVHRFLQAGAIVSNHLHHAGLLSNDLGMTYTYQTDGQGTVIAYNHIHHNLGRPPGRVGIYLDDWTRNHVVHHNVVWEVGEGMAMNPPNSTGHTVCHNTLDSDLAAIGMWWQKQEWHNMAGSRFVNNIFVAHLSRKIPPETVGTNLFKGADARFVDRKNGDYRLGTGSPAIDAGEMLPPWTDGFAGKAPDLGALESGKEPWAYGSTIPEREWMLLPEWEVLPGHRGPCYDPPKP